MDPFDGSLITSKLLSISLSWTIGPSSMNKPVKETASSNKPPELPLKSIISASIPISLSSETKLSTSLVVLLKYSSPRRLAAKSW